MPYVHVLVEAGLELEHARAVPTRVAPDPTQQVEVEPFAAPLRQVGTRPPSIANAPPQDAPEAHAAGRLEQDHAVGTLEARVAAIDAEKVSVEDPPLPCDGRCQRLPRLRLGRWRPPGPPEQHVEVHDREARPARDGERQLGFPCAAGAENHDTLHSGEASASSGAVAQDKTSMAAGDRSAVLAAIGEIVARTGPRERRAADIAEVTRRSGAYRWVGLYDVGELEIAILAWSGAGPPAHPRFPRTKGLSGSAVATGATVVANDVAGDPRYLDAFVDTRAEIIVPISIRGVVRGTVDVESDVANAFGTCDQAFLEACAAAARPLWR
jgi:L-methionine (R)-S-oxide reductase